MRLLRSFIRDLVAFKIPSIVVPLRLYRSNVKPHILKRFSELKYLIYAPAAAIPIYIACCDGDDKSNDCLSFADLRVYMKSKLLQIREQLKSRGKPTPSFSLRSIDDKLGDTHVIGLKLPSNFDLVLLLSFWVKVIGCSGDINIEIQSTDTKSPSLHLISKDRKSSIMVKTFRGISVEIFRDNGFTAQDADLVLEGYKNSMLSSAVVADQDDDNPTKMFRSIIDIFDRKNEMKGASPYSVDKESGDIVPDYALEESDLDRAAIIRELAGLGVRLYSTDAASSHAIGWDSLAGYEDVKRTLRDSLITAIKYPQIYDSIAKDTRVDFSPGCNRPRAVLFEGPPGTGKTLSARIIAGICGRPMLHLSVEHVVSKWYGDSEKKLAKIFELSERLGGAIIFLDEIDSLAPSRDSPSGIHEASRRMLSVLLQHLDGFASSNNKTVLICATNRKADLDPALLSRFGLSIAFPLPDQSTREAVFQRYAKQLTANERRELAEATDRFSCRDIKEVCDQTERSVASRLAEEEEKRRDGNGGSGAIGDVMGAVKGLFATTRSPSVEEYLRSVESRMGLVTTVTKQQPSVRI